MSERSYRYDAFISYRHSEPDRFVAEELHRRLETFRLPKHLIQKSGTQGKTRINRVFRDKDELPLSSNLAEPIVQALRESEFLIVICSPRLKESIWCRKEIETFVELRGVSHVLAVLAEGEPEESFPPQLTEKTVSHVREDGTEWVETIPMEPLAADVRGGSRREIRKKIKAEVLRIAAPMFGCGYDDLRQRHRERRLRRIMAATLAGGAVGLAFGGVSTAMALKIHRQSNEIEAQAERIEEQYKQALTTSSRIMADTSGRLLEEGDRLGAVEMAARAFAPGPDGEQKVYTAAAEYALAESLYVYENGGRILPDRILRAGTAVNFLELSPSGDRIAAADDFGYIYVWEGLTGRKLCEVRYDDNLGMVEDKAGFADNDHLFCPDMNGFALYDVDTGEKVYSKEIPFYGMALSGDREKAAVKGEDGVTVLDAVTGQEEEEIYIGEMYGYGGECCLNQDGSLLAAAYLEEGEEPFVAVYEVGTGEMKVRQSLETRNVGEMIFQGDTLYLIANEEMRWGEDAGFEEERWGSVRALDVRGGGWRWSYKNAAAPFFSLAFAGDGGKYVACVSYGGLEVIDALDGSLREEFQYDSQVTAVVPSAIEGDFLAFTRDGRYHFVNMRRGVDMVSEGYFKGNSGNVKEFLYGDGFFVSLPYGSAEVTVYKKGMGGGVETAWQGEDPVIMADVAGDGAALLAVEYAGEEKTRMSVVDVESGRTLFEREVLDTVFGAGFCGKNDEYVAAAFGDAIELYDSSTGELARRVDADGDLLNGAYISGDKLILDGYGAVLVFEADTGREVMRVKREGWLEAAAPLAVGCSGGGYAAVSAVNGELRIFRNREDAEPARSVQADGANITGLYFDQGETLLCAVYRDGRVRLYDTAELTLLREFADLGDRIIGVEGDGRRGELILRGNGNSYLLREELRTDGESWEITARVSRYQGLDGRKKRYLTYGGDCLYWTPVYTADRLLEEAAGLTREN